MNRISLPFLLAGMVLILLPSPGSAQKKVVLKNMQLEQLSVSAIHDNHDHLYPIEKHLPLVDFELNGKPCSSSAVEAHGINNLLSTTRLIQNFHPDSGVL